MAFTQGELERYKKDILNRYERSFNEREKTESRRYVSEYIWNFLTQEPIPGITFEFEYLKKILPTITLEEVNLLAPKWIKDVNRVVIVTGPDKEGVVLPTEQEIRDVLEQSGNKEITAYEDNVSDASLFEKKPESGEVVATKPLDIVEATELTLSNGIKVVLKSTDFKNDEILMSAYSLGGHSLYSDEDYYSASFAGQIVAQSGVKDFSQINLQKMFAGKTVGASPYIGTLQEGLRGNAAPKDLETLLQLVNLYFTAPRKDPSAFESIKTRNKMLFQNLMSNPQFYYSDQVSRIMTQNHPRGGGFPKEEDLDKVNFERAFEIYKDRFSDASDFTFFFVGSFDINEIKPMLEIYLGSLPSTKRKETWKDLGVRPPTGVVDKVINRGTDPKSQVTINFTGDYKPEKKDNYVLRSLGEILRNRLIDLIREEKSGVYTVGASGSFSKYPVERYTIRIAFPCGPENVDTLVKAVFDEIENVKKNGVSEEDIKKVQEAQRLDRKESLKQNRYWLNQLRSYYYNGSDLTSFYDYEKLIEELNSDDIKAAANKYFNMQNYVKAVLMPEE